MNQKVVQVSGQSGPHLKANQVHMSMSRLSLDKKGEGDSCKNGIMQWLNFGQQSSL